MTERSERNHEDVSARARVELQESRQMLQLVLDTIPARVFWKDREGVYLGCNHLFAQDAGLSSPEQIIGKTDYEMGWRDQAELYRSDDRLVMESGEPKLGYEEPQTTPSGETIWLRTSKIPLRDGEGRIIGVMGTYEDISARKRAEDEKAQLEAQYRQAQKMEAIGRLAGGVAHDFNNKLSVIRGHTELLLEGVEASSPQHDALREILTAAERSADLTRQLLAYARQQTIVPEALDLNQMLGGTLKMLERLIGEDIDLVWLPGDDLWTVRVDPSQIDQMLANLCVNARDAIDGVGRVEVQTRNVNIDGPFCTGHAGARPGAYVCLAVSDSGRGMDRETQARIFEPFFTTKGLGEGTGLGLAMVDGIVKQNGGFVHVHSEPGLGTSISVYLPRHEGELREPPESRQMDMTPRGDETILLVEDDPAILRLGEMLLRRLGYEVLTAGSPGEALVKAEEYDGRIQLLLTDVVMPEMNGRELAGRLQDRHPELRCLYMSGYTSDVIAHHGILQEGVRLLQKPFSLQDLAQRVRAVLS